MIIFAYLSDIFLHKKTPNIAAKQCWALVPTLAEKLILQRLRVGGV
ncbi:hypothetical protein F652_4208 [Enterobacteriaceae bacterium bta3-1]|nr:hypothetical protein F652_4208 [Enterobacteriaceae bacterium bta3-1]